LTRRTGKFVFANTLGLTQNLVVAGINLGPGAVNPPPTMPRTSSKWG